MKMKRCKCCGWYFEPKTIGQTYCDDECSEEGRRMAWRRYGKKRYAQKKAENAEKAKEGKGSQKALNLKVDISKLPTPMLPPTKKVRGMSLEDRKLQKIMEAMERQREYSDA